MPICPKRCGRFVSPLSTIRYLKHPDLDKASSLALNLLFLLATASLSALYETPGATKEGLARPRGFSLDTAGLGG
jgi:hypothetical protein